MAQLINKKFPLDSNESQAIGFGFPVNGDAVFRPTYQTVDQIKANLINYLLTNRGERFFNPNFGANLRNLLFSNISDETLDTLKARIQSDITNYFPTVKVNTIRFDQDMEFNTLNFVLDYSIEIFGIQDNLDILIQ